MSKKELHIKRRTGGRSMESFRKMAEAKQQGQRYVDQESAAKMERQVQGRLEMWKIHDRSPADALQVALKTGEEAEQAASSQTRRATAADW